MPKATDDLEFKRWINARHRPSAMELFDSAVEALAVEVDKIQPRLASAMSFLSMYGDLADELPHDLRADYERIWQDLLHRAHGSQTSRARRTPVLKMGNNAASNMARQILKTQRAYASSLAGARR